MQKKQSKTPGSKFSFFSCFKGAAIVVVLIKGCTCFCLGMETNERQLTCLLDQWLYHLDKEDKCLDHRAYDSAKYHQEQGDKKYIEVEKLFKIICTQLYR